MPISLPRSRFAVGVSAACLACALLLVVAVLVMTGRAPLAGPSIGGPFALVDQDGRTVTEADMAGRPFIVFFGYTHCPDVCPTMLADMTETLKALGPDAAMTALFVTVDPERDTPAVLKDYLSSFDSRIRGLTGDQAAIQAAEKAYRVYAKKVPTSGSDYSMDHTAVVYLMGKDGRFIAALDLDQPPQAAAKQVQDDLAASS